MSGIPIAVSASALAAAIAGVWRLSNVRGDAFEKWRGRRNTARASLEQIALQRLRELYGEMSKLPDLAAPDVPPRQFMNEAEHYLRPLRQIDRFDSSIRRLNIVLDAMLAGAVIGAAAALVLVLEKIGFAPAEAVAGVAAWFLGIGVLLVVSGFAGKVIFERAMVGIEQYAAGIG